MPALDRLASIASALALVGCAPGTPGAALSDAGDGGPPWDVTAGEPEPRPGMTWIPPGVLLAGTPPDRLPRVADEEMAGEQVVMHGFYADIYPYPNEAGAIPTTNVSQADAKALCEASGSGSAPSSSSSARARARTTPPTSTARSTRRPSAAPAWRDR